MAMRQRPSDTEMRNTLALAYFRSGRIEEAQQLLLKNLEESKADDLVFDLILLSMTSHQLGLKEMSQAHFEMAKRMRELHVSAATTTSNRLEILFQERASLSDATPSPQLP